MIHRSLVTFLELIRFINNWSVNFNGNPIWLQGTNKYYRNITTGLSQGILHNKNPKFCVYIKFNKEKITVSISH